MYHIYSIEYSRCSIIYHHILTVNSKEKVESLLNNEPYGLFACKLVSSN